MRYLIVICCLASLQACSFPKIASENAVITTSSIPGSQEPPIIAPRLLEQSTPIRTFSIQSASTMPWVSETILFPSNEFRLSPLAYSLITDFANRVRGSDENILIEGYTDNQDSMPYNQRLSENRAIAVRDALIEQGINPARLTISAHGENEPVALNDTAVGRQKNRRVEIKIMQATTVINLGQSH